VLASPQWRAWVRTFTFVVKRGEERLGWLLQRLIFQQLNNVLELAVKGQGPTQWHRDSGT